MVNDEQSIFVSAEESKSKAFIQFPPWRGGRQEKVG
jgi:hypothetical protein